MSNRIEGQPDEPNETPMEDVVEALRKKAERVQQQSDNQRTERAKEAMKDGASLESVFNIYFDQR